MNKIFFLLISALIFSATMSGIYLLTNDFNKNSSSTHYLTLGTDYITGDALPGDPNSLRPIGLGYEMKSHIIQNNETDKKTDITYTYDKDASIPGPIIKIKQYDTIKLTLQNGLEDGCVSVHVHGLEFDINNDGTLKLINGVSDQCATTQEDFEYTWYAGENSVGSWPYHDHTYCNSILQKKTGVSCESFRGVTGAEEIGLYGVIIIEDNREIISSESESVKMDYVLYMADSAQFHGIQLNHTSQLQTHLGINPDLSAKEGDKVRFTIIGVGSAFHTFHLHANKWLDPGTTNWIDTKTIGPMTVHTFEITAGDYGSGTGEFQYHCHLFDHMISGMQGTFRVI